MKKSFKETANQVLSQVGQKIPGTRTSPAWWGEVELPECLRTELEDSNSVQED